MYLAGLLGAMLAILSIPTNKLGTADVLKQTLFEFVHVEWKIGNETIRRQIIDLLKEI